MEKKDFALSPVFCLHNGAVVLKQDEENVTFGLLNDDDEVLKQRLDKAVCSKLKIPDGLSGSIFVTVNKDEFNKQISWMFANDGEKPEMDFISEKKLEESENEAAALLEALIGNAVKENATDIHIEKNNVRYRIRGKLIQEIELGEERKNSIVQRIKLLAELNVVEHRKPQDGNFVFNLGESKIFIRVSCLPIVGKNGNNDESIVLRLLDPNKIPLRLEKLGFDDNQIVLLKGFCNLESGLVLICGATGAGKSTTAGAMLEEIRNSCGDAKKIISLEDPPEYVLEGVSQVHIQDCNGLRFSEILKRALRQDPDVIFIGEIRDKETAEIAVQASMTGHLVFATLHTGSISQGILRMYDLGASPKLVNAVLMGIIVQSLKEGKLAAQIQKLNPEDLISSAPTSMLMEEK